MQSDSPVGPIVILQGDDSRRGPRLAVLTAAAAGTPATGAKLHLRADPPARTRQVSLVTARFGEIGTRPGRDAPVPAVILADPATTRLSITSSSVAGDGTFNAAARTAVVALDPSANAFTTAITGSTTDGQQWSAYAGDITP